MSLSDSFKATIGCWMKYFQPIIARIFKSEWFTHTWLLVCRRSADTNLVFIVNKSLWPQYHYLLPFDYRSGEYGTYNEGCSTAFLRILAALGCATDLRTIDTNTIRESLPECVKLQKPLVKVLEEKAYKYNFEDLMKPFKWTRGESTAWCHNTI